MYLCLRDPKMSEEGDRALLPPHREDGPHHEWPTMPTEKPLALFHGHSPALQVCRNTWGPEHGDTYQLDTRPAATLKPVLVALQKFAAMLIVFLLLGHYRGSLRSPTFAFKWKYY